MNVSKTTNKNRITMNEQEKARLEELESKDAAWREKRSAYVGAHIDDTNSSGSKKRRRLVYEGLTPEEMDEYGRLRLKRYWEWVLTDSAEEDARFAELQKADEAWKREREEKWASQTAAEMSDGYRDDLPGKRLKVVCSQPEETPPEEVDWDEEYYKLCNRHGMTLEDWHEYQKLVDKRQARLWLEFLPGNEDYDFDYLLDLLQFKINRMMDYWRWDCHNDDGEYILGQMELAVHLLGIIRNHGCDPGESCTRRLRHRVNLRNQARFTAQPTVWCPSKRHEVRWKKAWHLLFKLLEEKLQEWWD